MVPTGLSTPRALAKHRALRSLWIAVTLAALGSCPGAGQAQTDDEITTQAPAKPARKPAKEPLFHRHDTMSEDDNHTRVMLHGDTKLNVGTRSTGTAATGLALNRAALPGELEATPEASGALFDPPPNDLAIQPDPWETQPK